MCCSCAPRFWRLNRRSLKKTVEKQLGPSSRSAEKRGNEIDLCTQMYTMTARYAELAWCVAREVSCQPRHVNLCLHIYL